MQPLLKQVESKSMSPILVKRAGTLLSQEHFLQRLAEEQRRIARSLHSFILVLIDGVDELPSSTSAALEKALFTLIRDTDLSGWYKQGSTIGIIFTELPPQWEEKARSAILAKLTQELQLDNHNGSLPLRISAYVFPRDLHSKLPGNGDKEDVYEEIVALNQPQKKLYQAIKRAIDVVGASFALLLLAPTLFPLIALAIKFSSPGPVFFRQKRVGRYGRPFEFLKFRSMQVANNPECHVEYVTKFIRGEADQQVDAAGKPLYKLTKDPRVTRVGKFLRKTSLDELPQFWNVIRGEMSLVGPRPPLPYELDHYAPWHRRRILEAKPGITGLWQVYGRSRTSFDGMVRLDLRYASTWTPWLDLKILLRTPGAVINGSGAQ